MVTITNTLEVYKNQAMEAAKDLCYGNGVIKRLKEAKTTGEIERIMREARHGRRY